MTEHDMISVIIPCFNARPWIAETITSALQPCSQRVEIIVIDDGSTDGSADLVRAQFPAQVQVVTTPNRGVSQARNLGIELARGDTFVFLDADDVVTPGKFERQIHLLKTSGADVIYANWQRLRLDPDGSYRPAETTERRMQKPPEIELVADFWCPTGAYLFRRAIVEKTGGFLARFPVIQDARFVLDCALHGGRFAHDPNVACLYRTHAENSVSTRSRTAFLRDCLTNAIEIESHWRASGSLTRSQRQALLGVFNGVACGSLNVDASCFDLACCHAERLARRAILPGRWHTRLLARLIGYRRVLEVNARLRGILRPFRTTA